MTNRIRYYMKAEVEDLLPTLQVTYHAIGKYQKEPFPANQAEVDRLLSRAGEQLKTFKPAVQFKKQAYFDAILDSSLSTSDRIVAFDTAVGAMHIEVSTPRRYDHLESAALRRVLELARINPGDLDLIAPVENEMPVLCHGIPGSPGVATGKAAIVTKDSDYRRLASGSVVVTVMTRPELVVGLDSIAGIVTDIGGSLCHAAIVAREMGIPCVVGTRNATQVIKDKMLVCVDGSGGTVRRLR